MALGCCSITYIHVAFNFRCYYLLLYWLIGHIQTPMRKPSAMADWFGPLANSPKSYNSIVCVSIAHLHSTKTTLNETVSVQFDIFLFSIAICLLLVAKCKWMCVLCACCVDCSSMMVEFWHCLQLRAPLMNKSANISPLKIVFRLPCFHYGMKDIWK